MREWFRGSWKTKKKLDNVWINTLHILKRKSRRCNKRSKVYVVIEEQERGKPLYSINVLYTVRKIF